MTPQSVTTIPRSTAPNRPEAPLWTVTGQQFETRYVSGLDPIDEWCVYFTTRSGVNGQVSIPADGYTADMVAAAIHPLAEELERVANLTSEHHS